MTAPRTAACGEWASPIDAAMIAESSIRLAEPRPDGDGVAWLELRPAEGGRCEIVRRGPDGRTADLLGPDWNPRTRVHEYGGGGWLPCGDSYVFTNYADQRVYRLARGGSPVAIGPAGDVRHADFCLDPARRRVLAVREGHRGAGEPVNSIVALGLDEPDEQTLVEGGDFYSDPRLSGDGSRLAWLTWNHPDMPWDAAALWTAPVRQDGSLAEAVHVAGGDGESVAQPRWSPDGALHFVCDRTDWWNLYRLDDGGPVCLAPMAAEFAGPQWVLAGASYGFEAPGRIVCAYHADGRTHLARLGPDGGLTPIDTPYTAVGSLRVAGGRATFIGGSPDRHAAVVLLDLATGRCEELRRAGEAEIDPRYVSRPEAVTFPTAGGLEAHGLFYPPRNPDFAAPQGERPPLVVMAHGGPTGSASTALRLGIQYYTSRGLAVLDVNYGGSTGYGRAYRRRLEGQWGVVDVDDCCNGARHLAEAGRVDGDRMAITGGSAGGYTTLAALAFRDAFAAGASHFGVSDCEALAMETHKFESRYLDRLIGPYPAARDRYVQRSPIHHLDGFNCPIIFFQGLEDRIVPPNQARRMADALREKGLPVALLEFPGEQHGFRKAENIRRAVEGELSFFARVFGFTPADDLPPLPIDNDPGG